MDLSTFVSVTRTQINFQSNDSSYIPGISMIGRTAGGNHQITVYTWNPRLMLFIMSEVKSGSHYWHVKGDVRISCTNGRVSLLLNPDSLTSIPFGFGPDHEPRTIDLADRKIQDEAELRKLVLAQFDHELYSNFTAAADVFIDERIKFFYKEFEYTRLPLETVISLTMKAIDEEPVVYKLETEDA